jgi:hypothetical protein
MEGRHVELGSSLFPCFLLKDGEEAIIFLTPIDSPFTNQQEDTVLCTKSKSVANILGILYQGIWLHATDEEERLNELASGQPIA